MSSKRDRPFGGEIKKPTKNPLDTIFGEIEANAASTTVSLDQIHLPKSQPRRYFDPQALQQLVSSVRQHGVLQPLLVRPLESGEYELVAGERRYRAATEAGLSEVPIIERDLSDTEAFQLALVENLHREDLNPVDETEGILQLLSFRLEISIKEVAALLYRLKHESDKVSKQSGHSVMPNADESKESGHNVMPNSQLQEVQALFDELDLMTWESFVKNRLPLINLSEDVLDVLRSGKIEYTKARAIAQIKEQKQRDAALKKAIAEDWSLKQIREHVKSLKPGPEKALLRQQLDSTYQRAKKSKVWDDPTRQDRLRKLLNELEILLNE